MPLSGEGSILVDLPTNDSVVKRIKKIKVEEKKIVQEDLVVTQNEPEPEKKNEEKRQSWYQK